MGCGYSRPSQSSYKDSDAYLTGSKTGDTICTLLLYGAGITGCLFFVTNFQNYLNKQIKDKL